MKDSIMFVWTGSILSNTIINNPMVYTVYNIINYLWYYQSTPVAGQHSCEACKALQNTEIT